MLTDASLERMVQRQNPALYGLEELVSPSGFYIYIYDLPALVE
jgi:hypothetical protein